MWVTLYCIVLYIGVIKLLPFLAVIKLFSINAWIFLKSKSDAPCNAQKFEKFVWKETMELPALKLGGT
jgi:hypothetical protein